MGARAQIVVLIAAALLWGAAFGIVLGRKVERDRIEDGRSWIVDEQTTTIMLEEGEVDCVIHGRANGEGVVRIKLIRCGEGRRRGNG